MEQKIIIFIILEGTKGHYIHYFEMVHMEQKVIELYFLKHLQTSI